MAPLPANLPSKRHYPILDGLRGVAALTVVIFHIFETYSGENRFVQIINHGYLAVDFFFLLSGFVVAYAYDDRWDRMTMWEFAKRRLIRLQPMVIAGSVVGAALFYLGRGPVFTLIAATPPWKVLVAMLVGCTLIPYLPSMDIRGWGEMHPLNGPAWSLFFEYIANILYMLGLRRLSNRWLGVLVAAAAAFLFHYLIFGGRGDVIGGWSIDQTQLRIGFARLLFPFLAGMLLMRLGKRVTVPNAFLAASVLLLLALAIPRIGDQAHLWWNGLYEFAVITLLFPLIVAIGAGGTLPAGFATRLCKWLGAISYPLYITHYPLIYAYYAWVLPNKIPAGPGAVVGVLLFLTAVAIAYAFLKLYDEPVRAWLARRYLLERA